MVKLASLVVSARRWGRAAVTALHEALFAALERSDAARELFALVDRENLFAITARSAAPRPA
jgi:hypothetical protein